MSKSRRRDYQIIAVLVLVFIIVSIFTSGDGGGVNNPDYTVFSSNYRGASLLYDTMLEMGYPVDIDVSYITSQTNRDNIQVVISPSYVYTDTASIEEMANWVLQGGRLVYYGSYDSLSSTLRSRISAEPSEDVPYGKLYYYGLGKVFIGNVDDIVNVNLMEGSNPGRAVVEQMEAMGYSRIRFNEAYHGYAVRQRFIDTLPYGVKLVFYELIVISIAAVLYLGKRFGKPVIYAEEREREENEYVFTLSNLYMNTGMGNAAINAFENRFLEASRRYFRYPSPPELMEVYSLWSAEDLPNKDKLEFIIACSQNDYNTKRKSQRREFMKLTSYYRDLIQQLSKL